ncbi:MAG: Rpn family recombination-promoting nuclease/putative transposase [Acidobacteriota bacterium]|nr:Rpn family recombination-promoting nuclease/putative transposase [Acidobacteriota bacterium]
MSKPIDLTVDYAFRRTFATPGNEHLLMALLNAVFSCYDIVLKKVIIVNPFHDKEFEEDKETVVDVKATDSKGRQLHVEMQLTGHSWLHARIMYTWADIYCKELEEGQEYDELDPVFSVWILGKKMFPGSDALHHRFIMYDPDHEVTLTDHCAIHTLELPKCPREDTIESDLERWVYTLEHSKHIDPANPPEILHKPEIMEVMHMLNNISKKKEDYWAYQGRVNARRDRNAERKDFQRAIEAERKKTEAERRKVQAERKKVEAERKEKEAALQRIAELEVLARQNRQG